MKNLMSLPTLPRLHKSLLACLLLAAAPVHASSKETTPSKPDCPKGHVRVEVTTREVYPGPSGKPSPPTKETFCRKEQPKK